MKYCIRSWFSLFNFWYSTCSAFAEKKENLLNCCCWAQDFFVEESKNPYGSSIVCSGLNKYDPDPHSHDVLAEVTSLKYTFRVRVGESARFAWKFPNFLIKKALHNSNISKRTTVTYYSTICTHNMVLYYYVYYRTMRS